MTPSTETPRKWDCTSLGPRQAKAVKDALSAFAWKARSKRQIDDHGTSETTELFGGQWSETAREVMTGIQDAHDWTVTPATLKQFLEDMKDGLVRVNENMPTVDKRTTPEQRAEAEQARLQRERANMTQPFKVRASCGHIDIRRMREETAGVPYTEDTILEAPNGAPCGECQKSQSVSSPNQSGFSPNQSGITVTQNEAKDGVEIKFRDKPPSATLDALKSNGWRWSRFSKCWYKSRTAAAIAFAHKLAGIEAPSEDAGLKSMTDLDSQYEDACAERVGR